MINNRNLALIFTSILLFTTFFAEAQTSFGKATLINDAWLFLLKDEEEWSDRDVASMVLRDRNHPSVVMWSIGNEEVTGALAGVLMTMRLP